MSEIQKRQDVLKDYAIGIGYVPNETIESFCSKEEHMKDSMLKMLYSHYKNLVNASNIEYEFDIPYCDLPWYYLLLFQEAKEMAEEYRNYPLDPDEGEVEPYEWEEPAYWKGVREAILEVAPCSFAKVEMVEIHRHKINLRLQKERG